jgi:TatA/E family protein of Tat protein translocase
MFGLSFWEVAIVLGVALLILGPTKLPELAKSLGKGIREFRKATEDFKSTIDEEIHKPDPPKPRLEQPKEETQAQTVAAAGATDAPKEPVPAAGPDEPETPAGDADPAETPATRVTVEAGAEPASPDAPETRSA